MTVPDQTRPSGVSDSQRSQTNQRTQTRITNPLTDLRAGAEHIPPAWGGCWQTFASGKCVSVGHDAELEGITT